MLVQHHVNEAAAAALVGGAVVYLGIIGKDGIAQLVVNAVQRTAIVVDLVSDGFLCQKLLQFFHL